MVVVSASLVTVTGNYPTQGRTDTPLAASDKMWVVLKTYVADGETMTIDAVGQDHAHHFGQIAVGKIGRDQLEDYAHRKLTSAATMARWLADDTHVLSEWETDLSSQTGASQAGSRPA